MTAARKLAAPVPLEAQVSRDVARAIGALPDLILMRNNNGCFKDDKGQVVRFGLGVGTPDFIGLFVTPHGAHFVGFEIKRPGEKLREEQTKVHELWRKWGASVFTVHSAEEATQAVAELRSKFGGK